MLERFLKMEHNPFFANLIMMCVTSEPIELLDKRPRRKRDTEANEDPVHTSLLPRIPNPVACLASNDMIIFQLTINHTGIPQGLFSFLFSSPAKKVIEGLKAMNKGKKSLFVCTKMSTLNEVGQQKTEVRNNRSINAVSSKGQYKEHCKAHKENDL